MTYTIRQLNYFKHVYWDVVTEGDHDGLGLFSTPDDAQVFADNLNHGRAVPSLYDDQIMRFLVKC
jgi:hypothetical protein